MKKPELITLHSGRKVAVHRLAKGNDRTVVFCHPAPGAGNLDPDPDETAKREITLIATDRPGYGSSQPIAEDEWASVASSADDLAEVLQQMNISSVGAVGWSAGGRIALALAARYPDLVDRVVILAMPAPDEAVPWIPSEQKQGLEALRDLPPAEVHKRLTAQLATQAPKNASKEKLLDLIGRSPADEGALQIPGAADRLADMMRAALAQGATGMAADIAGYGLQPWGFKPTEVRAKALFLYGSKDPIAGSRHGA